MVAEKGHNSDDKNISQTTDIKRNNKDDNIVAGKAPSCWKSPLKCIIKTKELLEKAKSYAQSVTEDGLFLDPVELQKFEKNCVRLCDRHCYQIINVHESKTPKNY